MNLLNILPDSNYLTDEEVSVYVKKLADNNIPIYAVNESSSLEDKLISMMGENNEEFNKGWFI